MTMQKTATAEKIVNGVDVGRLLGTIEAVKGDPSIAVFKFRARNRWMGGTHNRSDIKDFYGAGKEDDTRTKSFTFDNDEPQVLLGQDRGANPVEYVLHALAGCMTTTMVCHASARGFKIESVESDLEGDIDVQGLLGLSDEVKKGYSEIRITFRVKSDATPQQLEELLKFSPVYDTITNPVRVSFKVEPR